ncbi:MAG: radical SAM protein [Sandaracinaceae bacterium]|nr:radical SAM protein [Sandaracinaceae bacterium]
MRIVESFAGVQNERFVLELADQARIEAVLYRGNTLCVSSQVGCAVRCPFCASGANGLGRNLSLDELVAQLELVRAMHPGIAYVTVSGIGEPLHNIANVGAFVEHCRKERIAPSFTTSGASPERLREAMHWPHNGVTISVHAGTEEVRKKLVPKAPTLAELFATLADVIPSLSQSRKRKVALAYLLMRGENDSDIEIDAFIARAKPLARAIHLYAYNTVDSSTTTPTSRARYDEVYARMRSAELVVRMSSQARTEANGGCGTLVAKKNLLTRSKSHAT